MRAVAAYKAAVEREQTGRECAFLRLPQRVGSFELRPMTALDYTTLHGIGSPYVSGGHATPADTWQFLWYQSVGYKPKAWLRRWLSEQRVIHHRNYYGLVVAVRAFVAESLDEMPRGSQSSGPSYYSWLASVVDLVASEYGWNMESIVNLPLRELGQYVKAIKRRHKKDCILFNPSDSLKREAVMEAHGQHN